MTAQPLAPVIPSSGVPASRQRAKAAEARRLPLARPVPVPSAPEEVVYGIARIDASGRICERAIITALGWADGDRLTFTADAGVVTARRDAGGKVTIGMAGQVAYHLLVQAGEARAPWGITTVVSCLPVLVLGMGTALAHMPRGDATAEDSQDSRWNSCPASRAVTVLPDPRLSARL